MTRYDFARGFHLAVVWASGTRPDGRLFVDEADRLRIRETATG